MARATQARRSSCSACTAWARASTARCCRTRSVRRAASMRRSASTATCSPISCGGCWRTAPTPRSCTSSPTSRSAWTSCCASPLHARAAAGAAAAAPTCTAPQPPQQRAASTSRSRRCARRCSSSAARDRRAARCRMADPRASRRRDRARSGRASRPGRARPVAERAAHPAPRRRRAGGAAAAVLRAAGEGSASRRWATAVAEVREAVDFLRYYADAGRARLAPHDAARARPARATSCA